MAAVVCLDVTDYPRELQEDTLKRLAEEARRLLRPGSPGALVWVRAIQANSMEQSAALLPKPIVVDRLAPFPQPPPTQLAVGGGKAYRRELHAYEQSKARWVQRATRAERALEMSLTELLSLRPRHSTPSDVWGCVTEGSSLLAGSQAIHRRLVFASDLQAVGPQNRGNIRLDGTRVRFVNYACAEVKPENARRGQRGAPALSCAQRETRWAADLAALGADVDPVFHRPGDPVPLLEG